MRWSRSSSERRDRNAKRTAPVGSAPGAVVLAGLLSMLPTATLAAIEEPLGDGVPLVLKDGRIASVSVHAIPFATGAEALDPATAAQLETTLRPLATDCFLTAQAIGHVAPGVTRDGDTLAAHRLARARADAIQAKLAALGMPQPAVASVWDWQFLVQESQVTLWVFSLTAGDDCEGTPLPLEAPALAAAGASEAAAPASPVAADEAQAPAAATVPPATAVADTEVESPAAAEPRDLAIPAPAIPAPATANSGSEPEAADHAAAGTLAAPVAATDQAAAADGVAADATTRRDGRPEPGPGDAAEPTRAAAGDPLATAAVAPAETRRPVPAPPAASAEAAASEPTEADVAAIDATSTPPGGDAGAAALVITFDVNSSFFPAGVGRQLRTFLESLPAAAPVRLEVAGAVGTGEVRGADAEEAKRYNAWMAERRMQRVTEWLAANAGDRSITITERLIENDPSRQVRLAASIER